MLTKVLNNIKVTNNAITNVGQEGYYIQMVFY